MQRARRAARLFRIRFAELNHVILQFAGELGALEREFTKERFQLRIFECFRRLAEAFLSVLERLDEAVEGGDNFFGLTHMH